MPGMVPAALALSLGVMGAHPALAGPRERAEAAQARGDLRAAQIEWRNAVREEPDAAAVRAALSATSLELGDSEMAEREARAALERGFDAVAGHRLLLRSYLVSGRFEALLKDFPEQQSPVVVGGLVAAARAQAQLVLGRKDEAAASAELARRLAPEAPEVGIVTSGVALASGDPAAAEKALDGVLARDPENLDALLRKGSLQFERKDSAAAIESFTRLLQRAPGHVQARLRRAEALVQLNQDARAREDVEAALKVMPGSVPGIYLRGVLLARAQDWVAADADLQRLGAGLANFPDAYLVQATVKRGLKQGAQAEDAARRHVARQPADPRGAKLLAVLALEDNRPQDAADVLSNLERRGGADAAALDMLGRVQAGLGRPAEAARTLEQAAALAPRDADLQGRLAAARLAAGDAAGTAEAAQRALQLGSTAPATRQMLAYAAMFRGDLPGAEAELSHLSPKDRQGEVGGVLEGTLATMRVDLAGARTAFENVLKDYPTSTTARMGLVRVAGLEEKPAEAERLLGEVLRQQPGHADAVSQLAAAAQPGRPRAAEARAVLEAAQAAAPGEPRLALVLAGLLVRNGEAAKAIAMLNAEPLRILPGTALPLARAEAYGAAGEWKEAEDASRHALAEAPDSVPARRQLAALLLRNGDARGAEVLIQQGLRNKPADAVLQQSLTGLILQSQGLEPALAEAGRLAKQASAQPASRALPGDLLMSAKRPAEAAQAYAAASKEAPSSILTVREASAWRAAGKPAEAATALKTWLSREPKDADALLLLSQFEIEGGRLDAAEQQLALAAAQKPQDAVVLNNLAWLQGRHAGAEAAAKAQATAERAYFLSPNAETADTLGWILARNGQAARAVPLLRRSVAARDTQQPDPAATFRLAYALREAGDRQAALALLTPVLAADTAFPERAEANRLLVQLRGTR
jgi:putative PEP-CTERM system TPR-repeat lipoprotein